GLVLAIGIVVDDSIVVVEAVQRHIDEGMRPREATIQALSEVSAPVVAIAFILAAVFIPVAFLGGISGQIYKQFALTIAVSVLLSAFNALSLSAGLRESALKADSSTETAMVRANCLYIWPLMPPRKATGMKTAARMKAMATTGAETSLSAWMVASRGGMPSSMWRCTASTTTMESSTTMPIASTSPNMLVMLMVNPRMGKSAKVPTTATGTGSRGIRVARQS